METHGRNPGKFPEEYPCYWSMFLIQDFLLKRGWKYVPRAAWHHADLSPCAAPVQSVWETSPLQTNPPSKHHPIWEAQCGRSQWAQVDTDWESVLEGSSVLPEQPLKSKRTACTHTGRVWTTEQSWFWLDQHTLVVVRVFTPPLKTQALDLVSGMGAKPHSAFSAKKVHACRWLPHGYDVLSYLAGSSVWKQNMVFPCPEIN